VDPSEGERMSLLTATKEPGRSRSVNPVMAVPSRRNHGEYREPEPIWLSALIATGCAARSHGQEHEVRWNSVAGRAFYTNFGGQQERIEPLGVTLAAGDTLMVYWMPGETSYTVEICTSTEKCA
jgi:hypothetical protein